MSSRNSNHAPQLYGREKSRRTSTLVTPPMTTTPCILHPSLTPGQKLYLYTVAKAYSEDHVRKLICQHYLNVLHRSISTDVSHTKDMTFRKPSPDVDLRPAPEEESSAGDARGVKPKAVSRKKRLVLPKINSHRKRPAQASTARKPRPLRRNKHQTSKGLAQWDTDEDSLLSDLSSMSLENADFLYIP